jgi:ABC-type Mn2+/Zn2+ transport system permease subunit
MQTLKYLADPALAGLYWPAVLTGLAIACICSLISVIVVLKRLAFIGQGVSHAALGGIGVSVALGLVGGGVAIATGQFAVVLTFCLGSGLLIGFMSERGRTEADTAIGVVLVAAMSLGAILLQKFSRGTVSWESFLFGSIFDVESRDVIVAWSVAFAMLIALWWFRRPLIFWSFDASVARAMGVREGAMKVLLMTALSLATVATMKLAGVVLATAMLVLPGAAALRLSNRWSIVLCLALGAGVLGVLGGLVLSFELDWLPGASIVTMLCALFACSWAWSVVRRA